MQSIAAGSSRDLSTAAPLPAVVPSIALSLPHINLEEHRVGDIPTVYYVPEVLTGEQEATILASVASTANDQHWVQLRGRRLQNWGGMPPSVHHPLPQWIREVRRRRRAGRGSPCRGKWCDFCMPYPMCLFSWALQPYPAACSRQQHRRTTAS